MQIAPPHTHTLWAGKDNTWETSENSKYHEHTFSNLQSLLKTQQKSTFRIVFYLRSLRGSKDFRHKYENQFSPAHVKSIQKQRNWRILRKSCPKWPQGYGWQSKLLKRCPAHGFLEKYGGSLQGIWTCLVGDFNSQKQTCLLSIGRSFYGNGNLRMYTHSKFGGKPDYDVFSSEKRTGHKAS